MAGISTQYTEVIVSLRKGASFTGVSPAKKSFTLLDASVEEMDGKTDVPL